MSGHNYGNKNIMTTVTDNPGISINEISTLTGFGVQDIIFIINVWETDGIVCTDTNPLEHYTCVWRIPF